MAVLPIIAAVASLAGAAVGALGQVQKGRAEADAAIYNANIAKEDATIAASQTEADVARLRRENLVRTGEAVAKGGVGGSNADLLASNIMEQELDILNTEYQGKLQQRSLLNTANLDLMRADPAIKQSRYAAAGALLGGVSGATSSAGSFG